MPVAIYETEEKAQEGRKIAETIGGQNKTLNEVIDFHGVVIHR